MFEPFLVLLSHTIGNDRRKTFKLFKPISAGLKSRVDQLRVILIIISIGQLARTKRKTAFAHGTNLLRKRLNAENNVIG